MNYLAFIMIHYNSSMSLYDRKMSSYSFRYSLSSSLSLYKGSYNPDQPYNKVFGTGERRLARIY